MILKQFFQTLSYVFHPIFIPLLGLYFLFSIQTDSISYDELGALYNFPDEVKYFTYIIIAILTVVAPLLSLWIMYVNKIITNLKMERREERIYPFVLISFYYLLAYIFMRVRLPVYYQHPALVGFIFGILVIFITCFIVNFYVKVSLHAAGIFGLCGMLIGYSQTQLPPDAGAGPTNLYLILYLFILAGIITGGRVYLKAHKLSEIILGAVIGFMVLFLTVKFGIYI